MFSKMGNVDNDVNIYNSNAPNGNNINSNGITADNINQGKANSVGDSNKSIINPDQDQSKKNAKKIKGKGSSETLLIVGITFAILQAAIPLVLTYVVGLNIGTTIGVAIGIGALFFFHRSGYILF